MRTIVRCVLFIYFISLFYNLNYIIMGFFDFLKKKVSGDDEIVSSYITRLKHLRDHLDCGEVSPYTIMVNLEGTVEGESYYTRYRFEFDDGPIRVIKVECDIKYVAWDREVQSELIKGGAVKMNHRIFYLLFIEYCEEYVKADVDLMEEIFVLADFCYNKNKDNIRISKIRGNINPAADLLDNDIWGNIPLGDR